jgi:hypothetical protein
MAEKMKLNGNSESTILDFDAADDLWGHNGH